MRVIYRVHYHTTNSRSNTAPTISTSLANFLQTLLFIAYFANCGTTINMNLADFTRAQTNLSVNSFFSKQNCRCSGRTCNLRTFTRFHLDTVNGCTNRDITDRQSIARFNGSLCTRNQYRTSLNASRGNDIAALTIYITQKSNMSSTIWIVFDSFHFSSNTILIALKIYHTIMMFVTTTFVTGSDMAIIITSGSSFFLLNQGRKWRTFMQTFSSYANHAASTSGSRLHFYNSHLTLLLISHSSGSLEIKLLTFNQTYISFFYIATTTNSATKTFHFTFGCSCRYRSHLNTKQKLNSSLNLRFGRIGQYFESHLVSLFSQQIAFFRNNRG